MDSHVVVVGLGYVGLPLAQAASAAGLKVVGLDRDEKVVCALNAGLSHIDDIADADIESMLSRGFTATADPAALGNADVAVICVPTPLSDDRRPDLTAVRAATQVIAKEMTSGMLVVLESTTYPGTTDTLVRGILEASGLTVGKEVNLAFSPERVDPGNPTWGIANTPKVVGGVTDACTERARAFYGQFIDTVVPAHSTREAEMAKLLENTFRHVNIALVNEMAKFSHELQIDFWDVIRCASTKPFGFMPFYPGPGVGGHCIPIDPNYLSYKVRQELGYPFRFVELAEEINASMPDYVALRAQDILNSAGKPVSGSTVLLLGVTYKANIADQRESPATSVAKRLCRLGAKVAFHDPNVEEWHVFDGVILERNEFPAEALARADLTILLQAHDEYLRDPLRDELQRAQVFDTRGVLSGPGVHRL